MPVDHSISWKTLLFEEPGLHTSAIRKVLMLSAAFVLLSTGIVAVFHYQLVSQVTAGSGPMLFIPDEMQAVYDSLPGVSDIVGRYLAIMLGLNLVVVGAIVYYAIHKLGRPLVLLRRYIHALGEGQLDIDIQLAKNDELNDIADSLSEATARIHMMILAIKDNVDLLESQADQADPQTISIVVDGCRAALAYFETMQMPEFDPDLMTADEQLYQPAATP